MRRAKPAPTTSGSGWTGPSLGATLQIAIRRPSARRGSCCPNAILAISTPYLLARGASVEGQRAAALRDRDQPALHLQRGAGAPARAHSLRDLAYVLGDDESRVARRRGVEVRHHPDLAGGQHGQPIGVARRGVDPGRDVLAVRRALDEHRVELDLVERVADLRRVVEPERRARPGVERLALDALAREPL